MYMYYSDCLNIYDAFAIISVKCFLQCSAVFLWRHCSNQYIEKIRLFVKSTYRVCPVNYVENT